MTPLVNLEPLLPLAGIALLVATPLLLLWWQKSRRAGSTGPAGRLAALTAITLFLTFDLIAFGAFTRLTDSGLGCPDWPGCYGEAHPLAAHAEISAAQAALPTGPVTVAKAWIEMIHRYLAMAVGFLILVAAVLGWRHRAHLPHSQAWGWLTLFWVLVQGGFGKYTVTLKLYPAIVTLHLLGALVLLALLVLQHESFSQRPLSRRVVSRGAVALVGAVVITQVALGGWVSTNYAVLACTGFPACNGQWWPQMDMAQGFVFLRELGRAGHGGYLPFEALVAIHWTHRLFAVVVTVALLWLARALWRSAEPGARRFAVALLALLLVQVLSGLSNVVLGWPIVGALAHSAGAAALVGTLTALWARLPGVSAAQPSPSSVARLRTA